MFIKCWEGIRIYEQDIKACRRLYIITAISICVRSSYYAEERWQQNFSRQNLSIKEEGNTDYEIVS